MSAVTLEETDAGMVRGGLDSLAVALADHDHVWTPGERCIFETAHELLGAKSKIQFVKRDEDGNLTDEPADDE